jgi:hypothetical protein
MLTLAQFRMKLEEDLKLAPGAPSVPKKIASMFPAVPNIVSAHRAARAKWVGEKKAALRQASMRLLAKQKIAKVGQPETETA